MAIRIIAIALMLGGGFAVFMAFYSYTRMLSPGEEVDIASVQANIKFWVMIAAALVVPAEILRRVSIYLRKRGADFMA